ncbi:MMPL family transporter [Nocardioides insulae]|uniref:MMPL family transporter n=1 Tax=Nocardioides insulae TaxID=394734 RepID=UPI0003FB3F45|nr:MMPL family transporter [Nocardioides insulae]
MHRRIAGALTGPVTKWIVLAGWLALFVVGSTFAQKLTDVQNNEAASWLPESAESTRALDRLSQFQDEEDIPTSVVYHREGGLTEADYAAIAEDATRIGEMDGVVPGSGGLPPVAFPTDEAAGQQIGLVSEDGEVAVVQTTFNFGPEGWNALPEVGEELNDIAALEDGGEVYVAGPGGQAITASAVFEGIDGTLLLAALAVVVVILLFTYRSPVLWALPIFCAVVGLMCSQGLIYLLARYADLTVNGQSQAILSVLVIGAGTDYALLLVARYREELRRREDRHEAMGFALHRAAPAIIASGSTVAIGMLCLMLAEMNSTAGLGPVAAIGIVVTILVMLTLLPALLVVTGRWVFWPFRPAFGSEEPTTTGIWARLGDRISRRPRRVWIGTAVVLAIASLGVLGMNQAPLATEDQYTKTFDSVTGQQLLAEHGPGDDSSPIQVVTDSAHADAVVDSLDQVEGIGPVNDQIPPVDGVQYIEVGTTLDPTSPEAADQVEEVRGAVHSVEGADVLVGGAAALTLDMAEASARDNLVIIPVILLVVLIILMVLLRSLLSPLLLIGTVVLSYGAAMGLSALIFDALGFAGTDPSFPLFVFVFLVALGIDYNIFLMSRVREETPEHGTRRASLIALASTGGVITSAGLVLAATFGVLGTIPMVSLAEIGIAVALGVVIDTFVVRAVLVTALNLDVGPPIWWPSRLDRPRDPSRVSAGESEKSVV